MKPGGSRGLIVGAALAVAISSLDTVGWLQWMSISRILRMNAKGGAEALATSGFVAMPSFSHRARRLAVRDLGTAPRELVVAGLTRLGSHQTNWMPVDPSGFSHLSHAALLGDQPTEALRRLGQALERDPKSPSLRRLRALVLVYLGVLDEALTDLAVAVALAPRLESPVVELPPEDEREVERRGLELRSELYPRQKIESAIALARVFRSEGDMETALARLEPHQGHPEVALERAAWALEDGDTATALVLLEGVTSRSANPRRIRAHAWSLMAAARDEGGDPEGALAAARAALEIEPSSPAPYVMLAALAQRRGDHDEALAHLRRAWGMAPTDVALLTRIASVALRAGRTADAVLALERAVEIEPGEPRHVVSLVTLQLETGDYTGAAVALSRALDRFPADPALLSLGERLRRDVGIR